MKISRAASGSMRAYWIVRSVTSGTPNRVTRSVATAAPERLLQRGSLTVRVTTWAPTSSAHSGSMAALTRAHNRLVSTSSALMTTSGCLRNRPDPGLMPKRAPRAPAYSRLAWSRTPTWERSPASRALWMVSQSGSASAADVATSGSMRTERQAARSCECRSCHSRIRR